MIIIVHMKSQDVRLKKEAYHVKWQEVIENDF